MWTRSLGRAMLSREIALWKSHDIVHSHEKCTSLCFFSWSDYSKLVEFSGQEYVSMLHLCSGWLWDACVPASTYAHYVKGTVQQGSFHRFFTNLHLCSLIGISALFEFGFEIKEIFASFYRLSAIIYSRKSILIISCIIICCASLYVLHFNSFQFANPAVQNACFS
jgi:hypothetical protein